MLFHYLAADTQGKIYEADLEAESVEEVLGVLIKQGLKPLSVKPLKEVVVIKDRLANLTGGGRITLQDKIFLMKYLSLMLRVGTDLFKALEILFQDFTKPAIRSFILEIKSNLEKGNPFYLSFENHPEIFSPIVVNLIKAAETSGNLEQTLMEISNAYAKEADLKSKVRSALIYPILLLTVSFGIVVLLVTFVLPRISVVFEGSGVAMPFYTRLIISFGRFVNRYALFILPSLFGSLVGLGIFFFKTKRGNQIFNHLLRKIPLVREIILKLAIQRFSATLGSLLKAGILFVTAVEITAEAVGEERMRRALIRIAKEEIVRGVPVGEAFRKEQIFPQVVVNLIAIGEKSGHLEEILATLADFYEKEIDEALKTFVSFLEPALLIFIGGIVALIAFSVIIPIYQLVSQYS